MSDTELTAGAHMDSTVMLYHLHDEVPVAMIVRDQGAERLEQGPQGATDEYSMLWECPQCHPGETRIGLALRVQTQVRVTTPEGSVAFYRPGGGGPTFGSQPVKDDD